ncbi:MAG TPA: selenocysteine-specific translation elongation factor [Pyrinomonadaceae bacterium]|nr:selenocysteine-specific translation elongation factor [Pyrinomonadaceae bacterium]
MEIIVGTAGHIDHGKTALIKALSGVDADRLPEEKRRGITVDLGFAEMSIGDVHFGFVDVPGHERFVKNMLAGASGIDIVMLVIAADEGVMPQTREHFDICRLLGVKAGIVVLTKLDLVDAETLEFAKLDAAELVEGSFLEHAPVIAVSSRSGSGIAELKETLLVVSRDLPARNDHLITRLPIDRSFSVKGFGAVVTGTLASGTIREGEDIELLPTKAKVRVRGVQTHGKAVRSASAGQRVAVNLGGIDHSKIERGMLLAEPGVMRPTQIFDAEIEVLADAAKPVRSRQRVRVHIGTVEALARIQVLNEAGEIAEGQKDLVQIRLETSVVAVPCERFIIRRYSPQLTIAGGIVIDNSAVKHRRKDLSKVREYLNSLSNTENSSEKTHLLITAAGPSGLSFADLRSRTGLQQNLVENATETLISADEVVNAEGRFVEKAAFETLIASVENAVGEFHKSDPLAKGISREALREKLFAYLPNEILHAVITELESAGTIALDRESIRLSSYQTTLSPAEAALKTKIFEAYRTAGLEVPKVEDVLNGAVAGTSFTRNDARKFFQLFLDSGEIVKVSEEFYFLKSEIAKLVEKLKQFAAASGDRSIDMAQFKDLAAVSRKYAIPLIEYFDRERVTVRRGDIRIIL